MYINTHTMTIRKDTIIHTKHLITHTRTHARTHTHLDIDTHTYIHTNTGYIHVLRLSNTTFLAMYCNDKK